MLVNEQSFTLKAPPAATDDDDGDAVENFNPPRQKLDCQMHLAMMNLLV